MPNTTTLLLVERKTVARDLAHTLTTGGVLDQPLSSALRFAASTTGLLFLDTLRQPQKFLSLEKMLFSTDLRKTTP